MGYAEDEVDDGAKCAKERGLLLSALTRPVEWLDARDLEGRPGKLPLSIRREMRDLVGMRLRPEEDALARLLPYHGLDSIYASEDL